MFNGKPLIGFLGYVLPYGQMSLWGNLSITLNFLESSLFLPSSLRNNFKLSNTNLSNTFNKNISRLIEVFIGILDGDGYIEIGPQKQYNKDPNINPKSTIRMRIVLRLHSKDKELLELLVNNLKIGNIYELKSKNQYRLIFYKVDILNFIYPYLKNNNIEFLTYNRRKQYFLLDYIINNNIIH
jgi:hypothetical protein